MFAQLVAETEPPRIAPARGPPQWDEAHAGGGEFRATGPEQTLTQRRLASL